MKTTALIFSCKKNKTGKRSCDLQIKLHPLPIQCVIESPLPPERKRAHPSITNAGQPTLPHQHEYKTLSSFLCCLLPLRDFKFQPLFQSSQSALPHWTLPPVNWAQQWSGSDFQHPTSFLIVFAYGKLPGSYQKSLLHKIFLTIIKCHTHTPRSHD